MFGRLSTRTFTIQKLSRAEDRLGMGGKLLAVAGAAVLIYGVVFLVLNFTSFIETGLSRQLVGGDAASIEAFSPGLYRYISHPIVIAGWALAYSGLPPRSR